jgi:photosystem II stability/assembly factor-like uncharacterized protein
MQPETPALPQFASYILAILILLTLLLTACSPSSATQTPASLTSPSALAQETATAAPTAPSTSPMPTTSASFPPLQSIAMQDAQTGWGLSQDAAFTTRDGGQRWKDVTPQAGWLVRSIVKGFFLDAHTAWLLQPEGQNFDRGTLFHTADGGRHWDSHPVPFGPNPMQFLDASHGWVMVGRGAAAGSMAVDIYKTADGGSTWTKVQSAGPQTQNQPGALPFGGDKLGMAFRDMQHGWIGGSQPIVGHSYLYRTNDGGQNWAFQDLAIPPAFSNSSVLIYAPKFFNSDDGLLPVSLEMQVANMDFYLTQDGGQTWHSTTVVQGSRAFDLLSFQDILVWDQAALNISHDSGSTWSTISPQNPLQGMVQQIDFVDSSTGWAISMDSQEHLYLHWTTDGGNTWMDLSP